MPSKNPEQRLLDIIENVGAIQTFTAQMNFAEFALDRKTIYAVTRALEIISEASRRLPNELRERHPEIDWVAVGAAGNVYRHEYESVDVSQLWRTLQHDLESLREIAAAELKRGN
jgi:uncharacterized protein with HEPN domain